jgi:hypothetical protein
MSHQRLKNLSPTLLGKGRQADLVPSDRIITDSILQSLLITNQGMEGGKGHS